MKFILLLIAFTSYAHAFKVEPMSGELELDGKKKYFNFVINNPSSDPLPIQVSLLSREMNKEGDDLLAETKLIEAFPDQLIIPAGQKRSVKVSYLGDDKIKDELAFRFIAEQLPLDLAENKKKKSGIKMLLKYVAAFYVVPKEVKPRIHCEVSAKKLLCQNSGNKHQLLNIKKINLKSGKEKVSFSGDELKGIQGENILAHSSRFFSLEVKKLKNIEYAAELEFQQ